MGEKGYDTQDKIRIFPDGFPISPPHCRSSVVSVRIDIPDRGFVEQDSENEKEYGKYHIRGNDSEYHLIKRRFFGRSCQYAAFHLRHYHLILRTDDGGSKKQRSRYTGEFVAYAHGADPLCGTFVGADDGDERICHGLENGQSGTDNEQRHKEKGVGSCQCGRPEHKGSGCHYPQTDQSPGLVSCLPQQVRCGDCHYQICNIESEGHQIGLDSAFKFARHFEIWNQNRVHP